MRYSAHPLTFCYFNSDSFVSLPVVLFCPNAHSGGKFEQQQKIGFVYLAIRGLKFFFAKLTRREVGLKSERKESVLVVVELGQRGVIGALITCSSTF